MLKNNYKIAPLEEKYLPQIFQIELDNYGKKISDWEGLIRDLYSYDGYKTSWICLDKDRVIGYAIAISYSKPELYLSDICVSSRYRNLGIAKELLRTLISNAKWNIVFSGHFNNFSTSLVLKIMGEFKNYSLSVQREFKNYYSKDNSAIYLNFIKNRLK